VREFVFIPSITIGAAVFPDDGEQTGALISRAHAALHRAKSAGRGRFEFFNEALTENSRRRLELNWELRKAVEENQLVLFYQPQISAADGALVGLEALVRWRHPRMGLLGPGAFLDHAEELGLLPLIGRWVRAAACRQLQTWGDTLPPGVRVAINVMPEELTTGLVEELRDLLDRTAVPAERLEIEVVEGAMSRGDEVPQILESVRRMGVGVAIDDFGTGFSSLARLRDLPFDCLKIDKQFIDGVATESRDRAIVDSIGSLGRNLRVRVLAEGVEDEQQVQELCLLEVDVFQGFHFSRPLPVDELEALFLVESEKLLKDALSS
jgi:EAL domain-containing protein (putative c-di-GMP-specific phosphodiesterase class I)